MRVPGQRGGSPVSHLGREQDRERRARRRRQARPDGFTSLAVLAGAAAAWLGYPVMDPVVGLGITVAILFIVKGSAASILRRMMDAVEPEIVDGIESAVAGVRGVERVESVRARWVGHRLHSEVSLRVAPDLSVAELSELRQTSFEKARRSVPKLSRLTVEPLPQEPASNR